MDERVMSAAATVEDGRIGPLPWLHPRRTGTHVALPGQGVIYGANVWHMPLIVFGSAPAEPRGAGEGGAAGAAPSLPPARALTIDARTSGEGGIRTRGPLLTDARLASGYLRPLGHLS
jgi:hypothetical protein